MQKSFSTEGIGSKENFKNKYSKLLQVDIGREGPMSGFCDNMWNHILPNTIHNHTGYVEEVTFPQWKTTTIHILDKHVGDNKSLSVLKM